MGGIWADKTAGNVAVDLSLLGFADSKEPVRFTEDLKAVKWE